MALPAYGAGASSGVRVVGGLALVCLIAGAVACVRCPTVARWAGIYGFVGMSLITWLFLGPRIDPASVEPVKSALGAVAWAIYAFGWGSARDLGRVPEDEPGVLRTRALPARGQLSAAALVVFSLSVAVALAPSWIAWTVVPKASALLAQAVAVAAGLGVLNAGAELALGHRSRQSAGSPSQRLVRAAGSIAVLVLLAMVGMVLELV